MGLLDALGMQNSPFAAWLQPPVAPTPATMSPGMALARQGGSPADTAWPGGIITDPALVRALGAPEAAGGQVRLGPDGKKYQAVQTAGDVGNPTAWGWEQVADQPPAPAQGLLGALGVKANPVTDFLHNNANGLQQGFAGMVGAGNDTRDALTGFVKGQNGQGGLLAGHALDQKQTADKQAQSATVKWLQANAPKYAALVASGSMSPTDAINAAMKDQGSNGSDPSSVQEYRFYANQAVKAGKAPMSFEDWRAGSNRAPRAGVGQPIAFRNKKTGELVYMQPMTAGPAVETKTGEPLANPDDYEPAPYDLAAARAGGGTDANTAAAARASLPGVEQAYAITQKALANFDPGTTDAAAKSVQAGEGENFSKLAGVWPQQMAPVIPSTNRANFKNLVDQLSGQAFLNIRQALKGAGQVTDYEGAKGEIALSRMKAAVDSGDDAAFKQALLDYRAAIDNGLKLLREQAKGSYAAGNVPGLQGGVAQGNGGNTTSTGVQWSVSQ